MLSREHVIHRSAGEGQNAGRGIVAVTRADGDSRLTRWIWAKAVLFVLIAGLLGAFVLLNRGSVAEPRVHLVFASYDRPSLMVVMLLTAVFGAAAALLGRAAFGTARQVRELRARSATASLARQPNVVKEPALAAGGAAY